MTDMNPISVCPLASGSRGNSLLVCCGRHSILIDAGLSGIEIERRLAARDVSAESLKAIVVTHEHADHVKGVGVLSRRYDIPVHINRETHRAASHIGTISDIHFFKCGTSFKIGDIRINPFTVSHDAADPSALTLEYGGNKIGVATDMGVATNVVKEHLKGSTLVYIEANHDPEMLINGPYPWHLKQRIKSREGHLSNIDSRELLSLLKKDRLKHVILAHLSEENNSPRKARQTAMEGLDKSAVTVDVAMPHTPGRVITL